MVVGNQGSPVCLETANTAREVEWQIIAFQLFFGFVSEAPSTMKPSASLLGVHPVADSED